MSEGRWYVTLECSRGCTFKDQVLFIPYGKRKKKDILTSHKIKRISADEATVLELQGAVRWDGARGNP